MTDVNEHEGGERDDDSLFGYPHRLADGYGLFRQCELCGIEATIPVSNRPRPLVKHGESLTQTQRYHIIGSVIA